MKLADFLKKLGMSGNEFGRKHDIPCSTIHKALNNGSINLDTASKIVKATKGQVDYEDLLVK